MRGVLWVPILLVGAAVHAALDGEAGIPAWLRLRGELEEAKVRMEELRGEIERLRGEAAALEEDPFAIERAIREDLALVRPGETLVRWAQRDPLKPSISLTKSP